MSETEQRQRDAKAAAASYTREVLQTLTRAHPDLARLPGAASSRKVSLREYWRVARVNPEARPLMALLAAAWFAYPSTRRIDAERARLSIPIPVDARRLRYQAAFPRWRNLAGHLAIDVSGQQVLLETVGWRLTSTMRTPGAANRAPVAVREWACAGMSDGDWLAWMLGEMFADRLGWLCWTVMTWSGYSSDLSAAPRAVLVDLGDEEQVQSALRLLPELACEAHITSWNAVHDRRVIEPRYEQIREQLRST